MTGAIMMGEKMDWDDAYDNMAYIAHATGYPASWQKRSAIFRQNWPLQKLDISYGETLREKLDLFLPNDTIKGLVVFVHGGYWMRFDKSYWSCFAQGALRLGYGVVMPSYSLTPNQRIYQITQQIGKSITHIANEIDAPIMLAGHSAGGHLVTRMLCDDSPLDKDIIMRITHIFSISGLHDLHPLMQTSMNTTLRLDEKEARQESPALHKPIADISVTAWVGGQERPEFIRQARILQSAWRNCQIIIEQEQHHFLVLEGLCNPQSRMMQRLMSH